MIDPRLGTLRALAEQGTVTAAAQVLHLTPSTVSQQLRSLARDLDVELLEADGRRVRITPAGRTLLGHADLLFAQSERARADLDAHRAGHAGLLTLCGVSSAVAALLAPAAATLRAANPALTLRVDEVDSDDCFLRLLSGAADVAVLIPTPASPPPDDTRFDQRPVLDEPQDLLVPTGHPLDRPGGVTLAEAAGETWIADPARTDQYQLLMVACAAAGFTPRITHHAKEWLAISGLVAHGFGVCLIPGLAPVPPDHAVSRVPLRGAPTPSRRLIAAIRRGSAGHPLIARALAAIHEAAT